MTAIRSRQMVVNKLLLLFLVTAVLAVGLAWLMQAAPAAADGTILYVPGDYPEIQQAIDVAEQGDEIRVQSGDYLEHLVVTKSLMLSGGWNVSFTEQTPDLTTIDATGGRGLVVTGAPVAQWAPAAIAPTVVVSGFRFEKGDATGLGGAVTPTVPVAPVVSVAARSASATTVAAAAAQLRADLQAVAARGAFAGGQAALDALLARADALAGQSAPPAAAAAPMAAAATPEGEIDCGGGIYVRGAHLHLIRVLVSDNVASSTGGGAGGALCAVEMPEGGLRLNGVAMSRNVASETGDGFGGALYFQGATVTGTQALQLSDVGFRNNTASVAAQGYGGAVFAAGAHAATVQLAVFAGNVATAGGLYGAGGGMYLVDSADVGIELVDFELNKAATTQRVADPAQWVIAQGGGLYLNNVHNLALTNDPDDTQSRSLFVGNLAAYDGLGAGGGLFGENVDGLRVEETEFLNNWAALYVGSQGDITGGGGIYLKGATAVHVDASIFRENVVGVFNVAQLNLLGGALDVSYATNVAVTGSTFMRNASGTTSTGGDSFGGAMSIGYSSAITVSGNQFEENTADLGLAGGLGGALHLQFVDDALVHGNSFLRNRAGAGAGIGGALVVEAAAAGAGGFPTQQQADAKLNNRITVSANRFLDNRAATDLSGEQALLGGAVAINSTNGLRLFNNVLAGNAARAGGALALIGWDATKVPHDAVRAAEVVNNTLVGNEGEEGVRIELWTTPVTLTNNVVVSHTVGFYVATNGPIPMKAAAAHNLYNANGADRRVDEGSTLEETDIVTGLVQFVDWTAGNFHLLPGSAAIDAGAGIPPAPNTDIDGTARPYGLGVDIGAYEWQGPRAILPWIVKPVCPPRTDVGWAVGEIVPGSPITGGAILHTVDGGATWQVQLTTPGVKYFGVAAVDAMNAWVTGSPGVILRTRDGGKTWARQALPAGVPANIELRAITAVDGTHAWTNGGLAKMPWYQMHTTDGATWQITPIDSSLPITAGFQDMKAVDATHVWAAGTLEEPGNDRAAGIVGFFDGQKWTRQGAGVFKNYLGSTGIALIGINAYDATHAWVVGGAETDVYQTVDGTSWFTNGRSYIPMGDTNTVVMADPTHGWAGGDHGVLYRTTDNWATFEQQGQFEGTFVTISAKDANTAWATTYAQMVAAGERDEPRGGRIVRTCDGGTSWEVQVPLEGYEFTTISFVGARR